MNCHSDQARPLGSRVALTLFLALAALLVGTTMAAAAALNDRPVAPLGDSDLEFLLAHTPSATPPGIYVSGPVYDPVADQSPQAVFTNTASGGSVGTFVAELSSLAPSNRFGLYDAANPAKKVELFGGAAGPGDQVIASFLADGTVWVNFLDSGITGFSGNFGFYLEVYGSDGNPATLDYTLYTEDSRNAGGEAYALVYRGNGLTQVRLPGFPAGLFQTYHWIIAFEDGAGSNSDFDFSDLVVMFESLAPGEVPPEEFGACRMTAGNVQTGGYDPVNDTWDGTYTTPVGKPANLSTGGGQIGAPSGAQPQPYGEWTHHLKPVKGVQDPFVFHMGTHSASKGTEIYEVVCSDCLEGNCKPARPASCQQIDWSGIGEFQDLKNGVFPFPGFYAGEVLAEKKTSRNATLHWAEGHVFDGGEPAANNPNDPSAQDPGDPLCPLADAMITDWFGDAESGGPSSRYFDGLCECPDFYRLKIYNGVYVKDLAFGPDGQLTPESIQTLQAQKALGPIYVGGGYVDPKGGNFQLHPPTGNPLNR